MNSSELFKDFDDTLRFLRAPWPLRNRVAARSMYAKLLRALKTCQAMTAVSPMTDDNLRRWHGYAVDRACLVVASSYEEFRSLTSDLVASVRMGCYLLVLALAAFCSNMLCRSWNRFPLENLELVPDHVPQFAECIDAVLAAKPSSTDELEFAAL